jgi:type III pantothenate kinase
MPAPHLLLIDAGNTRLKWATAEGRGKIKLRGEIATRKASPAWVRTLAKKFPAHRTVLALVVPSLVPSFRRAFPGRIHLVTGRSRALQFPFHYPRPSELGADRLAAAVAAHADGVWPVIVISCGTASAFTVLDARGRLCGGAIAPGLKTQLAALLGATAQLPATPLHPPRRLPAKSTREAIRAGVFLSFQGGAKEIVAQLSASLSGVRPPRLLLTGGDAHHLTRTLGPAATLRPLLVLEGLRIMGRRVFTPSP